MHATVDSCDKIMENSVGEAVPPRGAQPMPPPPVYLKPRRVPATRPLQYLQVDSLKSQANAALDARVPLFVEQTSASTVERSKAQVANPVVLSALKDILRQVVVDAMQIALVPVIDQVVDQASVDAGKLLAVDETKFTAQQALAFVETSNRPKAMSVLDAEVASLKTNQVLQSTIEKAVEAMLMETQSEVVSTLSHWALHRCVETQLQGQVFPAVLQTTLGTLSQYLQKLVRNGDLVPAATVESHATTRVAAVGVAAETMQRSLRLGPPPLPVPVVPWPLLAAAPAVSPALPSTALPSTALPSTALPSTVPPQAKKVALPVRAPQARYPLARPGPGPAHRAPQLDALPDDVLLEVLQCVDPTEILQCALVSRRWLRLSRSDALWRCKQIRYEPASRGAFAAVLRCAPALGMVDCEAMAASSSCGEHASSSSPGSMSDHDLLRLLHSPCRISGLRLPAVLPSAPSLVVSVLEKHKDTLGQVHLVSKPGQGDPGDLSAVLRAVDHLPELWQLTLAGPFNLEYTFGPRHMGAPRRKLKGLDLSEYSSTSAHTACSLLDAYAGSLFSVALPPCAGAQELRCLGSCRQLNKLTAAADVVALMRELPAVSRLTLKAPRRTSVLGFGCGSPPEKTAGGGRLRQLTLDGVPAAADIPGAVRKAVRSVTSLTLRRVNLEGHLRFVGQMPGVAHIVLDELEDLCDAHVRRLSAVKPNLRSIHVLRSLRCSEDICWAPVARYMEAAWPGADIHLDLHCECAQAGSAQ